ncbi:MAG: ABC transporter substrate-binding protein [Burkholderiales bacterium]
MKMPSSTRMSLFRFAILLITCVIGFAGTAHAQQRELRVGVASHVRTLDVQQMTSNAGAQFLPQIFDTLIERDNYASPLRFVPGLATSWKMVAPTTMELNLRDGVIMHDGTTMDAQDVKFSIERILDPKEPRYASARGRFFYNLKSVEVVNRLTVRVHTHKPDPLLETLLSARNAGITSMEYVNKVGKDKSALMPVGSGPYKVQNFRPNEALVMVRHDKFWGERPPLDKLTFTRIPEVTARITALINREVDFITNVPPDQEAAVSRVKGFKLLGSAPPVFHIWVINMSHPLMAKPEMRKALNLAVDREALVKALWNGQGIAPKAHQFKEYGAPMYMPDLSFYRHDPEQAKSLLKKAGYKGETINIMFFPEYYLYGNYAAVAVANMWKKIGINVKLLQSEPVFSSADHSNIQIRPWSNPLYYPDPMGVFDTHWSDSSWVTKRGLWKPDHPEWKATYEQARFGADPKARASAYRKLLQLSDQLSGWIVLYQPYESVAMRDDIEWRVPTAQRPYELAFRAGQISFKGR